MNNRLLLLTGLALSSPAWGTLYLGIGAGVDTADYRQRAVITNEDAKAINEAYFAAQGGMASIFLGYGRYYYQRFYLAGELSGSLSDAFFRGFNVELRKGAQSHTLYQIDHNWGVSLLPGYLVTDSTLLYGRAGYSDGRFIIRTTDISLASGTTWLNGFRAGVGIEKFITPKFAIRLEYNHIVYAMRTDTTIDPLSNTTKTTVVTPNTNQFEFDVDYHFT